MNNLKKAKRNQRILEKAITILKFLIIVVGILTIILIYYKIQKGENIAKAIGISGICGLGIIFCIVMMIVIFFNIMEQLEFCIRNYEECQIIMKILNEKNKEIIEIEPTDTSVFTKPQQLRDKDDLNICFYARIISDSEIEIEAVLFVDDIKSIIEGPIKINNFLYFDKHFRIK